MLQYQSFCVNQRAGLRPNGFANMNLFFQPYPFLKKKTFCTAEKYFITIKQLYSHSFKMQIQ